MNRRRFAFIVFAAVLSVVAVPIVVALVNRNLEEASVTASITGIVTALLSFVLVTATYWKLPKKVHFTTTPRETRTIRLPGKARPHRTLILTEGHAEAQLLTELSAIECQAQALLDEGPNSSVIRLRSRLRELGIWSDGDIYDFDVALRTRNEIAHGDQEELSKSSVLNAVETMQRLRKKLETSRLPEGT